MRFCWIVIFNKCIVSDRIGEAELVLLKVQRDQSLGGERLFFQAGEVQGLFGPVANLVADSQLRDAEVVARFDLDRNLGGRRDRQRFLGLDETNRGLDVELNLDVVRLRALRVSCPRHPSPRSGIPVSARDRRQFAGKPGAVDL